jgi:hypothetical protein
MLMRNIMEDNATQRMLPTSPPRAAVHAIVTSGDLNYTINVLTRNAARTFTPMTNGFDQHRHRADPVELLGHRPP